MSAPTDPGQHAFLVRLRTELREDQALPVEWRGCIEHLGSGQRRYFVDLREAVDFMQAYLESMGQGN